MRREVQKEKRKRRRAVTSCSLLRCYVTLEWISNRWPLWNRVVACSVIVRDQLGRRRVLGRLLRTAKEAYQPLLTEYIQNGKRLNEPTAQHRRSAADMKLSVRPCPLAGLGIRSQAVPRAALIRTHHTHSFLPRSDVLTQTYTREARSSHIRPANPPSLRPFSTTAANLQNKLDEMAAEPTGLIADSGIELLTWGLWHHTLPHPAKQLLTEA